jgi:DNA replication protein DnaC
MSNPSDTPRSYTPEQWRESEAVKVYDSLYLQQRLLQRALQASEHPLQSADWYRERFRGPVALASGATPEEYFVGIMAALGIPRWQDFAAARADAALLDEIGKLNAECRAIVDHFDPGIGPDRNALHEHVQRREQSMWPDSFAELDRIRADWSNIASVRREALHTAVELASAVRDALAAHRKVYNSQGATDPHDVKARTAEREAVAAVLAGKLPVAELRARLDEIAAQRFRDVVELEEQLRLTRLQVNIARIPRKFAPARHDPARVPNPGAFALVADHFVRLAKELEGGAWSTPLLERNVLCFGSKGQGKTRALWHGLHTLIQADHVWPHEVDFTVVNAADLADEIADLARTDTDALRAKVNFLAGREEEPGVEYYCQYLVIDDLSKAPLTERYGRELYKVVNARYEAGLPIYVTTQDGPEELVKAMARGDADVEKKLAAIIRRLTQDGDALMVDFDADYPASAKEPRP